MAIRKAFGGAVIRKPGSYSISKVDQSGGAPLGANGTLFVLGEAETGAPGATEGLQRFSASQLANLVAKYTSGPIVDAAKAALVSPSKTPGIGNADEIIVWKTNASTQAQLDLSNSTPTAIIRLKDLLWGAGGNLISVKVENGTDTVRQRIITTQRGDDRQVLDQNPALPQLTIQYVGAGSAAVLTIGGTLSNKTFVTTVTGDTPSNLSLSLKDYTVKQLAEYIDSLAGYTCTLNNTQLGALTPATDLDPVTAQDIMTAPVAEYRLQKEIVDLINLNSRHVSAAINALGVSVPVALANALLSGGAKGASTTANFSTGLAKSLAVNYGVALPCVSRDAAADIADNLTDASSTYDVDAIHAALDSHLRLRGSVKNRKEAQGMVGRRDLTIASSYAAAQVLGSELIQMFVQDCLVQDVNGDLVWKQPHIMAALHAGMRLGSEIGEPLTHKFISANGVGHAVDPVDGMPDGDFNPDIDFDQAIENGITFVEQAAGGFRCVVDNTTYGKDQSFVFNRGSVVEAAQFIAKTLRETAELVFVGQKVSNGTAASIKSVLRSKLLELNAANIITASDDGAPQGFKEDTFVVQVQGNTANVSVEVKPVQGLDFVFITFTLGDITQSA